MVVPVATLLHVDQEEVSLLEEAEEGVRVGPSGHRRAAFCVEYVENRRVDQEVVDVNGLSIEYLGTEKVRDSTRRL